jgi:hypothetical protein
MRATRRQRRAEICRRCTCGKPLRPHESHDDQLDLDELSRDPLGAGIRFGSSYRSGFPFGSEDWATDDGTQGRGLGLAVLDRYECGKCGTAFAMQRPLAVVISCLFFAFFVVIAITQGSLSDVALTLMLVGPFAAGVLGWDIYHRLRYPRIW